MAQDQLNPALAAQHTYYRVGVPHEHFGHYVEVGPGYTKKTALCGTEPLKPDAQGELVPTRWVVRGISGPMCNGCLSKACQQPSRVRPPPDRWYQRPQGG